MEVGVAQAAEATIGGVAVAAGVATMDTDEANTCEPGAI